MKLAIKFLEGIVNRLYGLEKKASALVNAFSFPVLNTSASIV